MLRGSVLAARRVLITSSVRYEQRIPEPITKFNPREKNRSLQYQKELAEYQKDPDSEYVVVPKGSIFEDANIRKMMEESAHGSTRKPRPTKRGSSQFPYLIRVRPFLLFSYVQITYYYTERI